MYPVRLVEEQELISIACKPGRRGWSADIPLDIKVAAYGMCCKRTWRAKRSRYQNCRRYWGRTLIKKGEIIKKVKEEELLDTLRQELLNWNK